jgi:hypothetical protein
MSTPPPSPGTTANPVADPPSVGAGGSQGTSQATGATGTSQGTVPPTGPSTVAGSNPSQGTGTVTMRATKRTKDELRNHGGLFDEDVVKQKYATRGTKECMQWTTTVTTGIESKFSTVKSDAVEDEQFESVYDLSMRVAELRTFIKQNGLASAFDIYATDSTGKPIISTARNILDDYGSITLDEVKSSTRGIQEWGEDHKVWAETIAMQLVSNSCDADLRQRVTERMIGIDDYDIGGATFFKLAI